MLKTRTSALAGAFDVDVGVDVVVIVDVAIEEPPVSESLPEPMAWNPTNRNTTPKNSSTMTMARNGSPEESRWFITAHCI
jgi:hypothetical protein